MRAIVITTLLCSASLLAAPKPPTGVKLEQLEFTDARVEITWDKTENARTYRVYRNGIERSIINGTSYIDKEVELDCKYIYFVIACNREKECSKPSAQQSFVFDGEQVQLEDPIIASPVFTEEAKGPENLAFIVEDGQAVLTWKEIPGVGKFNIYKNNEYLETFESQVPRYVISKHLPRDEYYITAIFPDKTISKKSHAVQGYQKMEWAEIEKKLANALAELEAYKRSCPVIFTEDFEK